MSAQPKLWLSPEEYLEIERKAERKSEYLNGEMFAMAGGSPEHSQLTVNIGAELVFLLKRRPCRVYSSDQRVRVDPVGLYTYPDVTVVCGDPRFSDEHRDILMNPLLIVEVLSDSTESYDRGWKSDQYRQLESLQEYLLVSQHEVRIAQYSREPDGRWLLTDAVGRDARLRLRSIDGELALADVYDKVEVDGTPPLRGRNPVSSAH